MLLQWRRASVVGSIFATLIAAGWGASHIASAASEPETSGGPTTFRRLNETQYIRSIEDIFGAGISIPGRFDPPLREEGLLAIGDGKAGVSSSGLEQYELRAREIAAQVLAEGRRHSVLSCASEPPTAFDKSCASQFIGHYGRLLMRRPVSDREMASLLALISAATAKTGSFYKGLGVGLERLLVSPYFIFRVERSEPDPDKPGAQRIDDYTLATRISFLLWDAPPDEALLDAASSGGLRREGRIENQVDRLISSARFEQGVRAFFADMFAYEQFDGLSKDQSIFPKYTSQLSKDAQEQSLRTITDFLVTKKGDYRDLFTTRTTFMNRGLGLIYKVPVDAGPSEWIPYTFGPDQQRAGLLTLAAFLMLDPSHEGRSSPTIRGKTVRELLLCEKVPPPPPNVNFNIVQDTHNPLYKTARQRLSTHRDNPSCAGCHSITDPLGLAMENYDAVGEYRTQENGAPIDASGSFEGKSYTDLISLGKILHDSPSVPSCVARRAYEYGVGRPVVADEREWLKYLDQAFADSQYRFTDLMRTIATSKAFQAASSTIVASK
jgi:hypothetical protein